MRRSALVLLLSCIAAGPGCFWSVKAVLPPVAPPPNVPTDVMLFTVPDDLVQSLRSPAVEAHLAFDLPRLEADDPERAAQVLRHEVRTGMTAQQVIWAFLCHPTELIDQGPPGGHTLLWGQGAPFAEGRFWVRLDEWSRVVSAGRY